MNELMRLCGGAMIVLCVILMLRTLRPELASLISLCACVIFISFALSAAAEPISYAAELISGYRSELASEELSEYVGVIFRSLGVALILQTAADVCRDSNEGALASRVELCGKATILAMSLPLLRRAVELAGELIFA